MLDIPIELFAVFMAMTLTSVAVGVGKSVPILVFAGGMFILTMSVSIDNIIMGYKYDVLITYDIPSDTITEDASTEEPINFQFTELVKILFGLMGSLVMLVGFMVYRGTT